MKLVFATNNQHKLQEARAILGERYDILSLEDIQCHCDIPETADTLDGNSLLKAQFIFDRYGLDCFADDTGLEVEALDMRPGVYSARFAGLDCNPANNRSKLLSEMADKVNRKAQFRTVVTLIINHQVHTFHGIVRGTLATEEAGEGGFGYDSLFIPEGYEQTFAQLPAATKNQISHRARALASLNTWLKNQ